MITAKQANSASSGAYRNFLCVLGLVTMPFQRLMGVLLRDPASSYSSSVCTPTSETPFAPYVAFLSRLCAYLFYLFWRLCFIMIVGGPCLYHLLGDSFSPVARMWFGPYALLVTLLLLDWQSVLSLRYKIILFSFPLVLCSVVLYYDFISFARFRAVSRSTREILKAMHPSQSYDISFIGTNTTQSSIQIYGIVEKEKQGELVAALRKQSMNTQWPAGPVRVKFYNRDAHRSADLSTATELGSYTFDKLFATPFPTNRFVEA